MKCLKLSCDREAKPGFEACSAIHGADIRGYRQDIDECSDADQSRSPGHGLRGLYTIEEALTYLK